MSSRPAPDEFLVGWTEHLAAPRDQFVCFVLIEQTDPLNFKQIGQRRTPADILEKNIEFLAGGKHNDNPAEHTAQAFEKPVVKFQDQTVYLVHQKNRRTAAAYG